MKFWENFFQKQQGKDVSFLILSQNASEQADMKMFQRAIREIISGLTKATGGRFPFSETTWEYNRYLAEAQIYHFHRYCKGSAESRTILPLVLKRFSIRDCYDMEPIPADRVYNWDADLENQAYFFMLEDGGHHPDGHTRHITPTKYVLIWREKRYDFFVYQEYRRGEVEVPVFSLIPQFGSNPVTEEEATAAAVGFYALVQTSRHCMEHAEQLGKYLETMYLQRKTVHMMLPPVWKNAQEVTDTFSLTLHKRTEREWISEKLMEESSILDMYGRKRMLSSDVLEWVSDKTQTLLFFSRYCSTKGVDADEYWMTPKKYVLLWNDRQFFFECFPQKCDPSGGFPKNALIPCFGNQSVYGTIELEDAVAILLGLRALMLLSPYFQEHEKETTAYIHEIQRRQAKEA